MPISWSLDDHPHFEFIRTPQTVAPGLQPARAVMQSWLDEFIYMKKTVDWGVLTYTMHPYVIGRGYRMLALEWLVDKLAKEGAVFMTMEQAAEEARAKLFGCDTSCHARSHQYSPTIEIRMPAAGMTASLVYGVVYFCASFATCSRIGRQVFCSFCTNAVSSAGVMWRTKPPLAASLALMSGSSSTVRMSAWTFRMIGVGRADRRQQDGPGADEEIGTVSATVGRSSNPGGRFKRVRRVP